VQRSIWDLSAAEEKFGAKFSISKNLHRKFKVFCADNDIDMSALVSQLIENYLKEQEEQKTRKIK
jgi:hypothetical protein